MTPHDDVYGPVRQQHQARVLKVLRAHGACTRAELAERVRLSRSSLSEIVGDLIARGAIIVSATDAGSRRGSGRPAERLSLDPGSAQYVGIDLGHRRAHVVVADAAHEIIGDAGLDYPETSTWDERLDRVVALVAELGRDQGLGFAALQSVAVGVVGPGNARWPGAQERQDVRGHVHRRISQAYGGVTVIVGNNTRFAALAEASVEGRGRAKDLVYVRLSEGIGGGVVVGGRLVPGSGGAAGELGHVTVVPDGAVCRCGRRGCLETVATAPAVLAAARAAGLVVDDLAALGRAADAGDPVAGRIVRTAAGHVATTLLAAVQLLDPAQVVVGGRVARELPRFVDHVREEIDADLAPSCGRPVLVRAAVLDDDDGALGALEVLYHQSPLIAGDTDLAGPGPGRQHAKELHMRQTATTSAWVVGA
ncbi:ROK family transcriptional regulator [Cellulomonas sp. PhB143]|uniref:ROK family transcriptional regulator n=1 Tax=Cellulomonas sp. PhB143 TaxID=2485186 RepID=UPI000F495925|nr:ROK family transcriptional regulator [Cellulomonas sp. PhB143]ROS75400.1 putative NBD/HSP70 family sugar kinase [Cellulomonas sp. PhB143]